MKQSFLEHEIVLSQPLLNHIFYIMLVTSVVFTLVMAQENVIFIATI